MVVHPHFNFTISICIHCSHHPIIPHEPPHRCTKGSTHGIAKVDLYQLRCRQQNLEMFLSPLSPTTAFGGHAKPGFSNCWLEGRKNFINISVKIGFFFHWNLRFEICVLRFFRKLCSMTFFRCKVMILTEWQSRFQFRLQDCFQVNQYLCHWTSRQLWWREWALATQGVNRSPELKLAGCL